MRKYRTTEYNTLKNKKISKEDNRQRVLGNGMVHGIVHDGLLRIYLLLHMFLC